MTDAEWFAALEEICSRVERMLKDAGNELSPSVKRLLYDIKDLLTNERQY